MGTHKDLLVWKKSIELVTLVYQITQTFPKEELYGLSNQMRRCAVSIPSNIAEGYGRCSDKEIRHFFAHFIRFCL
jgi:S23 ribosomal protein.